MGDMHTITDRHQRSMHACSGLSACVRTYVPDQDGDDEGDDGDEVQEDDGVGGACGLQSIVVEPHRQHRSIYVIVTIYILVLPPIQSRSSSY